MKVRHGRPKGPDKVRVEVKLERTLVQECKRLMDEEFQPSLSAWVVATLKRAVLSRRKK